MGCHATRWTTKEEDCQFLCLIIKVYLFGVFYVLCTFT